MFKRIYLNAKRCFILKRRLEIAYEALRQIVNDGTEFVYVDGSIGNDANDGSLESPLCTLRQAQITCDSKGIFVFEDYCPPDRKTLIASRYARNKRLAMGAIEKMKEIK